jgi:2-(1,2-epoxy-1,2-dihydrophenyl)acetyl-CoA isomerase
MRTLLVERSAGVTTITLNRPEVRNAMNVTLFEELRAVIDEAGRNPADRALVITGAGGAFSSGGDLITPPDEAGAEAEPIPMTTLKFLRGAVADAALALHRCPKPIIAAVDGLAAGAGVCLTFACDLVLVSETARFSLIFVRRSLCVDFAGSWLLPRIVGLHKAKELAFYGDWIDAQEASRIGVVNKVFPASEFHAGVRAWAERLAAQPPTAIATNKQLLNNASQLSLTEALDAEAMAQALCTASPEFAAAIAAFMQRRTPPGGPSSAPAK